MNHASGPGVESGQSSGAANAASNDAGDGATGPSRIGPDALRVLEFGLVREQLAERAATDAGAAAARAIVPEDDPARIGILLDETGEMLELLRGARAPALPVRDDGLGLLATARSQGAPLLALELAVLLRFLRAADELRRTLRALVDAPALRAIGLGMPDVAGLLDALEAAVDLGGGLQDGATPRLRGLRLSIAELKEDVRRRVERLGSRPELRSLLRSGHPSLRDGRFVLAVRAEARGQLKGLYHDRSATGATVYVEPEAVVEDQNRLQDLISDERREVVRILWELTRRALDEEAGLRATAAAVARVDLARARARLADDLGFERPEVGGPALELADARHPLLVALAFHKNAGTASERRAAALASVVPFFLSLGSAYDLLVLTGPNTGGKTATLKAVGLIALLPRCGCFVPAARGARVPLYPGVYADVGDEQSLAQNLSTFSAHVRRLAHILAEARRGALVLLDELGTGTDPLEGEALSTAILDELLARGAHALVTTHLGRLKEFAGTRERAANASMEFDPDSLRPTFRLLLGVPGASHALRIARNLGLPGEVVQAAEQVLAERGGGKSARLFDQIDRARGAVERLRAETAQDRRVAAEERDAASAARDAAERERAALRAQADAAAEELLRRLTAELEEPRRQLLALGGRAAHVAGALLEALRRAHQSAPLAVYRKRFVKGLKPGDTVFLPRFNEICRVRRVLKGEERVEVDYRSMSVTVTFDEIAPPESSRLSRPPGSR